MSKRSSNTPPRPERIKPAPDFQLGYPNRVIMDETGKAQLLPAALAYAQAEFAMSVRVDKHNGDMLVLGSVKVPCFDCHSLCWRSPSTPARIRLLCVECTMARMAAEQAAKQAAKGTSK